MGETERERKNEQAGGCHWVRVEPSMVEEFAETSAPKHSEIGTSSMTHRKIQQWR